MVCILLVAALSTIAAHISQKSESARYDIRVGVMMYLEKCVSRAIELRANVIGQDISKELSSSA